MPRCSIARAYSVVDSSHLLTLISIISPTSSTLPELKAQFSTNHASITDAINFPGPLVPLNTPRQAHYDDLLQPDSNTYENIRAQDCKKDDIILMKPYYEKLKQLCWILSAGCYRSGLGVLTCFSGICLKDGSPKLADVKGGTVDRRLVVGRV